MRSSSPPDSAANASKARACRLFTCPPALRCHPLDDTAAGSVDRPWPGGVRDRGLARLPIKRYKNVSEGHHLVECPPWGCVMGSSIAALFAAPDVVAEAAGDSWLLRSAEPLGDYPVSVVHSLRAWAGQDPGHPLVAERAVKGAGEVGGGSWRTCTYGEAAAAADS